jgi:hypothetical protein
MSHTTNSTDSLIFVEKYKLQSEILHFLRTSVIASHFTDDFVGAPHSSILSIPHKVSPFRFSLIFQMAYSVANLNSNESQELQM